MTKRGMTLASSAFGGRVFKWKGQVVSAAPAALFATVSSIALGSAAASAADITTQLTTPQVFTTDEDHSITSTGAVLVTSSTVAAVEIDLDYDSTFTNAGTLSVTGSSIETATGILVDGDLLANGEIFNTGTIVIDISNGDDAEAYGINIDGDVHGLIENSGTIDLTALGEDETGSALGIYIDGGLSTTGVIRNTGIIQVRAISTFDSYAYGYGIQIDGDANGVIENTGTIDVLATAPTTYEIFAHGIEVDENLGGTIRNSGMIKIRGVTRGDSEAEVFGINVEGDVLTKGMIGNSGTIDLAADAVEDAAAYGINTVGELSGQVDNSGVIELLAVSETEDATAIGIVADSGVTGTITNSGTIDLQAIAEEDVEAYGIFAETLLSGSVTNRGKITVRSKADTATADGIGVFVLDQQGGLVRNSGTIDITVSSNDGLAQAGGIVSVGTVESAAEIVNSGTIRANSTSGSSTEIAYAVGVDVANMQGSFANSGKISARAVGGDEAVAIGISFSQFDGVITDLGTIEVSAADVEYAVFLENGTGTMHVDTEDDVGALMFVNAHSVILDARGGSNIFRFEDDDPNAGTFTKVISDPGSAWFVQDEGGEMPIYATVDTSDLNINANVLADISGLMSDISDQLGGQGLDPRVTRASNRMAFLPETDLDREGFRPFAVSAIERLSYEATDQLSGTDATIGNVTIGMSGQLSNGLDLAFGMGTVVVDGNTGANDFEIDGVYAGFAVGTELAGFSVDAGLGLGILETDKTRSITNGGGADAEYDSTFITAHIGAERRFATRSDLGVRVFGSLRHTRQNDDGYRERGSDANATVGERTISITEAQLGLELVKSFGFGGQVAGKISALSRDVSEDDATNVVVFDQSASLSSADSDFDGVNIGIGYQQKIMNSALLDISIQGEMGDGGARPRLRAGLSWSF